MKCAEQKNIRVVKRTEDEGDSTVSPTAPARALIHEPGLQIELRETGGVGGVQRTVALAGDTLRVTERGDLRLELRLPGNVIRTFMDRVKALESIQPRSKYGRYTYASDILTTKLEILDDSKGLQVQVVSDPRDPAPRQFWEIVNGLRKLSKMDVQATAQATAFDF
jgi:hypothetical protein